MDSPFIDDLNSLRGTARNHLRFRQWFITLAWSQLAFFVAAVSYFFNYRASDSSNKNTPLAILLFLCLISLVFALFMQFSKASFSNRKFTLLLYLVGELLVAVLLSVFLNFLN